jgi:hypothetical protein
MRVKWEGYGRRLQYIVMSGLVPGIHVFAAV